MGARPDTCEDAQMTQTDRLRSELDRLGTEYRVTDGKNIRNTYYKGMYGITFKFSECRFPDGTYKTILDVENPYLENHELTANEILRMTVKGYIDRGY